MEMALDAKAIAIQLLAVTTIWKLISQNYKGRNVIKNSVIYIKINKMDDKLKRGIVQLQPEADDEENRTDLRTVLEYVTKMLKN